VLYPILNLLTFECIVDAVKGHDAILELEVAAWPQGRESGFDDVEVRFETDGQGAAVDVVELAREGPRVFSIFDLEVAV
jgi:hypothetical protein